MGENQAGNHGQDELVLKLKGVLSCRRKAQGTGGPMARGALAGSRSGQWWDEVAELRVVLAAVLPQCAIKEHLDGRGIGCWAV